MSFLEIAVVTAFLFLSVAFLAALAVWYLVRKRKENLTGDSGGSSAASRLLVICTYLIGSVWCLRFAVGYFTIVSPSVDGAKLEWWEEIVNSLLHTLQTFSMDEDYTGYIMDGKTMLREMFGVNTFWAEVYGVYASALNFIAPVAGGAMVFEILASFFPQIRLWFANWSFKRDKYYFSKLNEASVALAKSVYNAGKKAKRKPVLIFADVSSDSKEHDAELLQEVNNIGAICMEKDLVHIKKTAKGTAKFFLMDENEVKNLRMLTAVMDGSNMKYLKNQEIFFFTNDDAYVQVEKNIRRKLLSEPGVSAADLPLVTPVRCYRNLISKMLVDIPLYEPLIRKKRDSDGCVDLTVTVLGTGYIGREMFLSTYWIGQMLDCRLHINVLSQETEEEFWDKIDYINPEIRRTTQANDPILYVNRQGDVAQPYCSVRYTQCEVRSSAFIDYIGENADATKLLNTDYFLVSLGSDEENIAVANKLKRYVQRHHLLTPDHGQTVITYVVYDSELADILNHTRHFGYKKGVCDVYMSAVGNLQDVYSVENVFMTEHEEAARKSYEAYSIIQDKNFRIEAHQKRLKDDYNHWSDRARAMHARYKLFSMGLIDVTVFDGRSADDPEYLRAVIEACNRFEAMFTDNTALDDEQKKAREKLMHRMAWLEKRRWNAFIRVMGFMQTKQYSVYGEPGTKGSYKQMDIQLHPCLLECSDQGIHGQFGENWTIDGETVLKAQDRSQFDLLDDLSYDLVEQKLNGYDFKQYDYPDSDRKLIRVTAQRLQQRLHPATKTN